VQSPLVVLFLLGPVAAGGQTPGQASSGLPAPESPVYAANEPGTALKQGKVLRAFRIVTTPPAIDGLLNDEVWTFAESAGNYIQRDPDNGEPMTETSHMQVAYDDRYVYVAILCEDSAPAAIASGLGRRDEFPSTDYVSIGFDPRHDHLTGYIFQTNPSSVQADQSVSNDDQFDRDYNAVWEVRAQSVAHGWSAEFRIPFSQMRFAVSPQAGQVWGFQAERSIRRKGEKGTWVGKPRGERGEVSLFGHLVFDTRLVASRRVEITPYTLVRGERADADETSGLGAAVGADVRIGLGSAATLAATINPDFGQVEQDPSVLNLSVFETFYPEKRPFFLEDSRTFVPPLPYGLFQLFHSRRIGRSPSHFPVDSDHDVVDRPDETTILGAAKITGKTGEWTYGGLTAVTAREYAAVNTDRFERYEHLAEPLTSYNVMRLQRDIFGGSSNVGALVTGVFRERSDDAYTGGVDYNLRWDQNRAVLNGHWVATRAPGVNGVRTGDGGFTNFNVSRKHWGTWVHYDHFGRNFRVGDLGFFRARTNRNAVDGGINVEQPDPGRIFRSYGGNVCGGQGWNDERLVFDQWVCFNGFVTSLNFWNMRGGVTRRFRTLDDIDTRGGPPIVNPGGVFYYFNINSDSRKSWRIEFGGNGKQGTEGDRERAFSASLSVQPSGQLQLSVAGRFVRGTDIAQWIENSDTNQDGVVDHVYGTLRRNVVDVTLRGTYSINRDLTLQAYLQPFVAVGDYEHVRRLARPRSFDFEPVAIDSDPDFNRKSLRGNVVLRWEYVRGSTLFVVWDLSQEDTSRAGVFDPRRDLRDAFRADARHAFIMKVSYWLNR
jgi:hypothetical protein